MLISEILSSLAMIFIMMVPGFIFRKKDLLDEHQVDAVTSVTVNLTWPCLVIDAMQVNFSIDILKQSGYIMAVSMVLFAVIALSHGIRIDIWQYRIYRDTGDESIVWFRSIVFYSDNRAGE